MREISCRERGEGKVVRARVRARALERVYTESNSFADQGDLYNNFICCNAQETHRVKLNYNMIIIALFAFLSYN